MLFVSLSFQIYLFYNYVLCRRLFTAWSNRCLMLMIRSIIKLTILIFYKNKYLRYVTQLILKNYQMKHARILKVLLQLSLLLGSYYAVEMRIMQILDQTFIPKQFYWTFYSRLKIICRVMIKFNYTLVQSKILWLWYLMRKYENRPPTFLFHLSSSLLSLPPRNFALFSATRARDGGSEKRSSSMVSPKSSSLIKH